MAPDLGSARAAGGQAGQRRAWCGRRGGPCSRGGVVSGTTESHPRADSAEAWQGRCAPSRQCGHVTSPTFLCVGRFSLLGSPLHKMLWLLKTRVLILPRGPGRAPGAGDGGGGGRPAPSSRAETAAGRPGGGAALTASPLQPCTESSSTRTRRPPSPTTASGRRWASSSPSGTAPSCASASSSTSSWASCA